MVDGEDLVQLGRSQGVKLQFVCDDYRIKMCVFVLYFRSTSYFFNIKPLKVIGQADWGLIISLLAGEMGFLFIFALQPVLVLARLL